MLDQWSVGLNYWALTKVIQRIEDTEDIKAIFYSLLGEVVDSIVSATTLKRRCEKH